MKTTALFSILAILSLVARADVLFQDSSNYPYTDGSIEGQGQWYAYYPGIPYRDALVTNNVLLLSATNHDELAAPSNGWVNANSLTFASFSINVGQLPDGTNGGYFCQFQDNHDTNDCCHVFIDTRDTKTPGTYRLGIGNFSTSFSNLQPPNNYPMDLATGITYTVVIAYDKDQVSPIVGATLWINPSRQDFENAYNGVFTGVPGVGLGYAYGTDITTSPSLLNIDVSQIGFSPYVNAGIGNVIAGTTFEEVNTTNLPVFGIQPQSGTDYSGNSAVFHAVASGVDLQYQWYSAGHGMLSDGANYTGTTSNILVVNTLTASDTYYCVASDAYGNQATSSDATETVDTTPTPVFFPLTVSSEELTNNLFTSTGFTNQAVGTGPISYQWYFAPTNTPDTYAPLAGQTSAVLNLFLGDYGYQGNYFVMASNMISGGSIAYGPTNTLSEMAPVLATMSQLHNLMISFTNEIQSNPYQTISINTNNVTVGGYVSQFNGYGTSYTEYFVQDASGLGIEIFLYGYGNTNTPPIGTYVTVTGPIVIYNGTLEIEPNSPDAITPSEAPLISVAPRIANDMLHDLAGNGSGTNALLYNASLLTFTNVYIYGTSSGGALGTGGSHSGVGGIFYSNSYTKLYFTVGGPYDAGTGNTNMMTIYQPGYNFGPAASPVKYNEFGGAAIPTNCYQLTGVYSVYGNSGEIIPSRLADYVTNAPPFFAVSVELNKGIPSLAWLAQAGSTYSIYSADNIHGPWRPVVSGLGYYPTNGAFADTNKSAMKFYRVSSP